MPLAVILLAPPFCHAAPHALRLRVMASYIPGIPVLVRVELNQDDGAIDREIWDAEAVLSVDSEGVTLSTNRVRIINGMGSALVAFQGDADFQLTAEVEGTMDERALRSLADVPMQEISGTLQGSATTWSGIVHVTNDVVVPVGHTLTITPNTWVLIDAVTAGPPAPDLLIHGKLVSEGTDTEPITITSSDPVLHWGQIRHETAEPSVYRHTIVTRAGQAPKEPHTNRGPAIRCTESRIDLDFCTISDLSDASGRPGKVMQATNSTVIINDCLMARSRMGPEFDATIVRCTNSWFVEMNVGIDDEDGIYIHYQGPGRDASLVGCVIADITDDGVDTIGSDLVVRDCIIRDVTDKGMSITGGESNGHVFVDHCLIINCSKGLSSKGATTHNVFVNRTTISVRDQGVFAEERAVTDDSLIRYYITNSIVEATAPGDVAIYTDYGITNVFVHYSNTPGTNWAGAGNISGDPLFTDRVARDYHLLALSPCVDAGDPVAPLDPDGTRADMGRFYFPQVVAGTLRLLNPRVTANGRFSFFARGESGQAYRILASGDFQEWDSVAVVTNMAAQWEWTDPNPLGSHLFYRVETEP